MNDLQALLTALQRLPELVDRLAAALNRLDVQGLEGDDPTTLPMELDEQLVTLDQAAAMVRRAKSTLERYRDRMPPPRVVGHRGRASMWRWEDIRPFLMAEFGFLLPERFPGARAA